MSVPCGRADLAPLPPLPGYGIPAPGVFEQTGGTAAAEEHEFSEAGVVGQPRVAARSGPVGGQQAPFVAVPAPRFRVEPVGRLAAEEHDHSRARVIDHRVAAARRRADERLAFGPGGAVVGPRVVGQSVAGRATEEHDLAAGAVVAHRQRAAADRMSLELSLQPALAVPLPGLMKAARRAGAAAEEHGDAALRVEGHGVMCADVRARGGAARPGARHRRPFPRVAHRGGRGAAAVQHEAVAVRVEGNRGAGSHRRLRLPGRVALHPVQAVVLPEVRERLAAFALSAEEHDHAAVGVVGHDVFRAGGRGVVELPLAPRASVPFPRIAECRGVRAAEEDNHAPRAVVGQRVAVAGRGGVRRRRRLPLLAVPQPGVAGGRAVGESAAEQQRDAAPGVVRQCVPLAARRGAALVREPDPVGPVEAPQIRREEHSGRPAAAEQQRQAGRLVECHRRRNSRQVRRRVVRVVRSVEDGPRRAVVFGRGVERLVAAEENAPAAVGVEDGRVQ